MRMSVGGNGAVAPDHTAFRLLTISDSASARLYTRKMLISPFNPPNPVPCAPPKPPAGMSGMPDATPGQSGFPAIQFTEDKQPPAIFHMRLGDEACELMEIVDGKNRAL